MLPNVRQKIIFIYYNFSTLKASFFIYIVLQITKCPLFCVSIISFSLTKRNLIKALHTLW